MLVTCKYNVTVMSLMCFYDMLKEGECKNLHQDNRKRKFDQRSSIPKLSHDVGLVEPATLQCNILQCDMVAVYEASIATLFILCLKNNWPYGRRFNTRAEGCSSEWLLNPACNASGSQDVAGIKL